MKTVIIVATCAMSSVACAQCEPEWLGTLGQDMVDVAIAGDVAYVAAGDPSDDLGHVKIVDLSDPTDIREVGFVDVPAYRVEVEADVLYVRTTGQPNGQGFLEIFDISEPFTPVHLSTFDDTYFWDFAVDEGYVYAARSLPLRLQIIDATDPSSPTLVNTVLFGGGLDHPHIAAADGVALLPTTFGLVHVVDVSDARHPSWVTQSFWLGDDQDYSGMAIEDDKAYLVSEDAFQTIDISNPAAPDLIAQIDSPLQGHYRRFLIEDGIGYRDDNGVLTIADVTDPFDHELLGNITTFGPERYGLDVRDGLLITIADVLELVSIDVSDVTSPVVQQVTDWSLKGAEQVEAIDGLAYVANPSGGLQIIDTSVPASMTLIGKALTPANEIALVGDLAYTANVDGYGMRIVDVSNPSSPVIRGGASAPQMRRFSASDGVAVGSDWIEPQVYVFDAADPDDPFLASALGDTDALGVTMMGSTLLVFEELVDGFELSAFDVSDPASPSLLSSLEVPHTGRLAVDDGIAYLADDLAMTTVDVSDAGNMVILAETDLDGTGINQVHDLVVRDGILALVGGFTDDVHLFNVVDPSSPQYWGQTPIQGKHGRSVSFSGDVALVIAESSSNNESIVSIDLSDCFNAADCYPDFNADGALNILDFIAFQTAFVNDDLAADCDSNAQLNILDFVCFQIAFGEGCR